MGMKYVRDYYKVPAKRGSRVAILTLDGKVTGKEGTILSATHNLKVRVDGIKNPLRYHPLTLAYLDT